MQRIFFTTYYILRIMVQLLQNTCFWSSVTKWSQLVYLENSCMEGTIVPAFNNRPGEAGAALQTALLIIKRVIPPNLQNTFIPKLQEIGTQHLSHGKCQMSHVKCQVSSVICFFFIYFFFLFFFYF